MNSMVRNEHGNEEAQTRRYNYYASLYLECLGNQLELLGSFHTDKGDENQAEIRKIKH